MADIPEVHVVIDTNCLYTEAEDKLLSKEISEYIKRSTDNILRWYIPSIVKMERHFQMVEKAEKFQPNVTKLERLLGHNYGITREAIMVAISTLIDRHINEHGLIEITFDPGAINWPALVERSAYRRLPFVKNDNSEKGFRDAVLLEIFWQIVPQLSTNPTECQIVMLSNDDLVKDALTERIGQARNISVLKTLDDLQSLINAIVSHLSDEDVKLILPRASAIFFNEFDNDSVFSSANIVKTIHSTFSAVLLQRPAEFHANVTFTELGFSIKAPTFVEKKGATLRFVSKVNYRMEATELASPTQSIERIGILDWTRRDASWVVNSKMTTVGFGSVSTIPSTVTLYGSTIPSVSVVSSTGYSVPPLFPASRRRNGIHTFEVNWTATWTAKRELQNPQLVDIRHHSSTWEPQ
jgi:hypothetical protein